MALSCNRCGTPMDVDLSMCHACDSHISAFTKPEHLLDMEAVKDWERRGVARNIKLCDCENAIDNLRERVARLEEYLIEPDFDIDLDTLPHELEDK